MDPSRRENAKWRRVRREPQGVYVRENESIPVQPVGVLGVELHELVEENVGNGSHSPSMEVSIGRSVEKKEGEGGVSGFTNIGAPGWPELLLAVASACCQDRGLAMALDRR